MKKLSLILLFFTLTSLSTFSQEKKLLLRYDEVWKSELDIQNERYIEKGKTKTLGTILVYSKLVMIYSEKEDTYKSYKIDEVKKDGDRELLISKTGKESFVFALTKDRTYFTQIGKKERFIYRIIDHKYAEE